MIRSAGLANMLSMAKFMPNCESYVHEYDTDHFLFNVGNGTIDLRTGELQPHDPHDMITKLAPVQFDPDACCPKWLEFLSTIMADNEALIQYLQRMTGMCMTGDVGEQYLFIFHGSGCNGKSVFLDTISGLMGDYAGEAAPGLLTTDGQRNHPTEIADLCGRRLIIASETEENATLKIQLIKRLTGNARLKARHMREDFFEFDRTHKLILVTNNRPEVHEDTLAVWRRIRLIPFTVSIPEQQQDKNLTHKLESEWPGILNWLIRGGLDWQQCGLCEPDEVIEATGDYRAEQHPLDLFFEECCSFDPFEITPVNELKDRYVLWCRNHGKKELLSSRKFNNELRNRGCECKLERNGDQVHKCWHGLKLEHIIEFL